MVSKEKRQSAKSDVSKVLFPDIGKITNRFTQISTWMVFSRYLTDGTNQYILETNISKIG